MKKYAKHFVLLVGCLLLAACGGGGSGPGQNATTSPNVAAGPSIVELDNAKAILTVQTDKTTFQPAMVGNYFVHLSDGTREVFIDKKNVVKVFFNGAAVGWHSLDSSKGVDLKYDSSASHTFTIAGQSLSPVFGANFSFLTDDRRELSQITDAKWLNIIVGAGMLAERKEDGLLYGSSAVVPVPAQTKTVVNINTVTGEVDITLGIVGDKLINLVNSHPTEGVLDVNGQIIAGYRIVWNDNGNWYPAAGKITALQLPTTNIVGAAKAVGTGAGMPYLVCPDGTFMPFNTDPANTTFRVNGILTPVNADGLVHY